MKNNLINMQNSPTLCWQSQKLQEELSSTSRIDSRGQLTVFRTWLCFCRNGCVVQRLSLGKRVGVVAWSLYEENKQACAKHTFSQDLLYFPKTDCCQSSDTHIHTHYIYPKQSVSTFGMPWACQLRMKPVFLKPCTVAISTKEDVFLHSDCHYEIYWLQLKVNVTFCYEKTKKRI